MRKIFKKGRLAEIVSLTKKLADLRARHAERHKPSGFEFAISDSLAALAASAWDDVTMDAPIWMQRRYLTILEQTAPENVKLKFVLLLRGGEPVGAVAAQIATISGKRVNAKALATKTAKVIVCGNLFSWGPHGVAFKKGENPAELWKGVCEALYRIRRAERLAGQPAIQIIKDTPESSRGDMEPVHRFSYRSVETDPDMVLDIPPSWKKYEDYLSSLNSKYRKSVREIIKEVDAAGLKIERAPDPASISDEIYQLYLQIHEQAPVRPVTISKSYIPALALCLGDDFRCTILRYKSEIVGFITTLRDGETAVGYYVGVDRKLNNTIPIYHRLLHITISDAIDMGCRRLSLGRTALEAKARLGARPTPLFLWARHRVNAFNAVLRPILRAVPHGEAPERNPFK